MVIQQYEYRQGRNDKQNADAHDFSNFSIKIWFKEAKQMLQNL